MLSINMLGIFAGIKIQSRRLDNFKADINKFDVLFDFNIGRFLRFYEMN